MAQSANGNLGTPPYMDIKDEFTLQQCISYIDGETSERLLMLRGIRFLTTTSLDYRLTDILINSEELVIKLFALLQDTDQFQMSFQEKSECLWILTNLACDQAVCFKMLTQWHVYPLIQTLFSQYFVREAETTPSTSLDEFELAFLEQLLWFTANVIADSDKSHVAAFEH